MEIRKPYKYAPIVEKKYKWSTAEKRAIEKALKDASAEMSVQFHSSGVKSGTITVHRYAKEPSNPEYRIGRGGRGVSSDELIAYHAAQQQYYERDQGLKVEIIDALIAAGYNAAQFIEEWRDRLSRSYFQSDYRFVRVRPTPASKFVLNSLLDEGDLKWLRARLIDLAAETFIERRSRNGRRRINRISDEESIYETEATDIPTILNEALAALASWEEIDLSIDEQYCPVFHAEVEERIASLDELADKRSKETHINVFDVTSYKDKIRTWRIIVKYVQGWDREHRAQLTTTDPVEGIDFIRRQMQIEGTENRRDPAYTKMLEAAYERKLDELVFATQRILELDDPRM